MAKAKVEVELTTGQEISLMERYGRGCSRETLVDRAIAEVVTLKTPWQKPVREPRKKAEPQDQPDGGSLGSTELDTAYDRIVNSQSESESSDA